VLQDSFRMHTTHNSHLQSRDMANRAQERKPPGSPQPLGLWLMDFPLPYTKHSNANRVERRDRAFLRDWRASWHALEAFHHKPRLLLCQSQAVMTH
jgi:hypothetical protein